ncbi:hypothetical protein R1sor_012579 [Riccia sorocarpa]|uniref:nepenthesin n=1 Tax=Riccia sorocarpa TaxID=122646 RepID=A0ABD3I471_9MARC
MGNRGACIWVTLTLAMVALVDARVMDGKTSSKIQTRVLELGNLPDYSSSKSTGSFGGSLRKETVSQAEGLVVGLWHRYSRNSPFIPKGTKRSDLMRDTILRDKQRLAMFADQIEMASRGLSLRDLSIPQDDPKSMDMQLEATNSGTPDLVSPVISGLALGSGEYFTRLDVGTPEVPTYLVVDTGSDILWMQCDPCANCYSQRDTIFNPKNSSSYNELSCSAAWCQALDVSGCKENKCVYQVSYGDGSFTVGHFSMETFTMQTANKDDKVKVNNVPFGCGHDNEGLFVGAAGILGLGKGSLALPNRLDAKYAKRFSYCLVNKDSGMENPSSLVFGDAAIPPSDSKVKYTPQLFNERIPSFYYVGLSGISVGGNLLDIPAGTFELRANTGKGGVIVDSGTAITWFNAAGYQVLRDAFREGTTHLPGSSSPFELFDTCYDLSNYTSVDVPTLTMHFDGGAELDLPAKNYVIPVDEIGRYCLAFASSSSNFSIIGNVQQQNFRVVYDNVENRIGMNYG